MNNIIEYNRGILWISLNALCLFSLNDVFACVSRGPPFRFQEMAILPMHGFMIIPGPTLANDSFLYKSRELGVLN